MPGGLPAAYKQSTRRPCPGRRLPHGLVQLRPAITPARAEHVAGQTFAVNAHENFSPPGHVAMHQRQVMLAVNFGTGRDANRNRRSRSASFTVSTRSTSFSRVRRCFDQVGNVQIFRRCFLANFSKLRQARHRAVVVHDFAEDAHGLAFRERGAGPPAASVWPARWRTPPGRARSGNTCPRCTRSSGTAFVRPGF